MDHLFLVMTPLGFRVGCSKERWDLISVVKHPPLAGQLDAVVETLESPDEIRVSTQDDSVLLFHRRVAPRWICAVAKRQEGDGFLITAYPADKVKVGRILWKK